MLKFRYFNFLRKKLFLFSSSSNNQQQQINTSQDEILRAELLREQNFSEEKFSDFQKEFGFYDTLIQVKKLSKQKESGRVFAFSVLGVLLISCGLTSAFFLLDSEEFKKSMKQTYYTHLCNFKLISLDFFSSHQGVLKRKLNIIQKYQLDMTSSGLKSPKFYMLLSKEVADIIARMQIQLTQNKNSIEEYSQLFDQTMEILQQIYRILTSHKNYSEYLSQFFKNTLEMTIELNSYQIFKQFINSKQSENNKKNLKFLVEITKNLCLQTEDIKASYEAVSLLHILSTCQEVELFANEQEMAELLKKYNQIFLKIETEFKQLQNQQTDEISRDDYSRFKKITQYKIAKAVYSKLLTIVDGMDSFQLQK